MYPFICHGRFGRSQIVFAMLCVVMILIAGCHDDDRMKGPDGNGADGISVTTRTGRFAILEQGLEYRRYVIPGNRDVLVRELGQYAVKQSAAKDAKAISSIVRLLPAKMKRDPFVHLEENGFRFFSIPIDEIAEVLRGLNLQPVHDSTWLGLISSWTSVAEGPAVRGTRILTIGGQQLTYNEGRFRLLVRSYPVRSAQAGAAPFLQLELLPQWHHPQPVSQFLPVNPQTRELAGQLFTNFAGVVSLDGTSALLVVGNDPADVWADTKHAGGESSDHSPRDTIKESIDLHREERPNSQSRATEYYDKQGPETIPIKTIGEEVLNTSRNPRQMILVFIPHLKLNR